MEYKKYGNVIAVKMLPGDEVMDVVKTVALKENIKCAKIEAIGATNEFTIGAYNVPERKYYKSDFKGSWEIVSLLGNITTQNGEFYLHLHMCAADEEGKAVGGHLNKAVIGVTCEMFITLIDGNIDRMVDETTGMNVFKF